MPFAYGAALNFHLPHSCCVNSASLGMSEVRPVALLCQYGPSGGKAGSWDFTQAVRYWTDGEHPNHGFILYGVPNTDHLNIFTREIGTPRIVRAWRRSTSRSEGGKFSTWCVRLRRPLSFLRIALARGKGCHTVGFRSLASVPIWHPPAGRAGWRPRAENRWPRARTDVRVRSADENGAPKHVPSIPMAHRSPGSR